MIQPAAPPLPSRCVACGTRTEQVAPEAHWVRSNVRAFRDRRFAIWRCARCRSLHARDEVDLEHYYASYPFFTVRADLRLRLLHDHQLERLWRAGVRRDHVILDHGCGGGHFVQHLVQRGFHQVCGYDRYCAEFRAPEALARSYDCVLSQDVLEHVADPRALLGTLDALCKPGGVIAIGTPNADAIDLQAAERYIHALHLPYHRHILSRQALLRAAADYDWQLLRYYSTQYANTCIPFLNSRFYQFYAERLDATLDCLMEPPRPAALAARLPEALFWGLAGSFYAEETDVMFVFRKLRDTASRGRASAPRGLL
jgi:2-polyprenyl-3-methyl-5-hydroxy-6-metoxy-1,4-benzoquinol methylase